MLSENISARRVQLGLRKIDIARRCGVAKSTVSGWESGRVPRAHHLDALARELRTTVAKLYATVAIARSAA